MTRSNSKTYGEVTVESCSAVHSGPSTSPAQAAVSVVGVTTKTRSTSADEDSIWARTSSRSDGTSSGS
jgi:hypothetical protein